MNKETSSLPITIIIPVYKVKYYEFKKCLDSIENQSKKPVSVVIIDDGNNDSVIDKLVSTFKEHVNQKIAVTYIRLAENNGISTSRNIGLEHVNTPWVSFLDADDWIKENYLERLFEETKNDNADIIACSCYAYDGKSFIRNHFFKENRTFKGETLEILEKAFINQAYLREGTTISTAIGVPWGKLYKFDVVKNILFNPTLKRMEDNIWNHTIIKINPNIVVKYIDEPLYIYRTNHIKEYNNTFESDIQTWLNIIKIRKNLIKEHIGKNDETEQFFYKEVVQIFVYILRKKYFHKENKHRTKSFKELKEMLSDATINTAIKKGCEGPIYRNVMLKFILRQNFYLAYITNKVRRR